MKEPINYAKPGRMLSNLPYGSKSSEKFPELIGRPVKYNQDGSGRDTYVLATHGGFEKSGGNSTTFKVAFQKSLRKYDINEFYLQRRQGKMF